MPMDIEQLRQFLVDCNKAGYAAGEEKDWVKEPDGSTTIPFEKGLWRSHDNFFGGEPYGGRVIVLYDSKPSWIMVYYGWVNESADPNPVYEVLRNALMRMPQEAPFRGPKEYRQDSFTYVNAWEGDLEKYSGEEQIVQGDEIIYTANYLGGLVDQRKGV
ncbi:MAG: DUF5680 domain-containing protein [Candidatus Spechtbacterales bacterium]